MSPADSGVRRLRWLVYWATTMIIAIESAVGGVWDVLRTDYVRTILEEQLEYPFYVAIIIGIGKIPGAVVLVLPRLPRLKEWVYAGIFFIYSGAVVSHFAVGDVPTAMGPLGFAVITAISWLTRPSSRRSLGSPPGVGKRSLTFSASRPQTIIFWAMTVIIAGVLFSGGIADLSQRPDTAAGVIALGYPSYFVIIIGVWKLLGTVALLVPRFPRLKEWAYAGAFYNFAGAMVSHLVVGSAVHHVLWTGLFALLTLGSWLLRPDSRVVSPTVKGQGDAAPRRTADSNDVPVTS